MKRHFFVIICLLIIAGCGTNAFDGLDDKDTDEAIQAQIIKDLDEGRYLDVLRNPNANDLDYSAAAMGLAGLNTTNLLRAISIISDAGANNNDISPITGLPLNPDVLKVLDPGGSGLDVLRESRDRLLNSATIDAVRAFQIVMLSLVDIAANIGAGVEDLLGLGKASDGISSGEAGDLGNPLDPTAVAIIDAFVGRVDIDIKDINTHRQTAGLGTGPVALALISIVNEIDADGNGTVTRAEIQAYLQNILGN